MGRCPLRAMALNGEMHFKKADLRQISLIAKREQGVQSTQTDHTDRPQALCSAVSPHPLPHPPPAPSFWRLPQLSLGQVVKNASRQQGAAQRTLPFSKNKSKYSWHAAEGIPGEVSRWPTQPVPKSLPLAPRQLVSGFL